GITGRELWKSDGTGAGTVLVKDIKAGSAGSGASGLRNVNGTLYFAADDGATGMELWRSDGTADGTVLVADINPGSASSSPAGLTVAGSHFFFSADDGVHGRELWDPPTVNGGFSPTLVALGGATPKPIPLPLALAASPFDPPGFDIYQNFQGPADANPEVTPLLGNEPNQITDFIGVYGGVRVQGDGIGHQGSEADQSFFWDADLRFMKGVYRGLNGKLYVRT